MKRTTYIMMGVVVAGMVIILASMYYLASQSDPQRDTLAIEGNLKTVDLPACPVVKFNLDYSEATWAAVFKDCSLQVAPSKKAQGGMSYPEEWEAYMNWDVKGDTLLITLNPSLNKVAEGSYRYLKVQSDPILLFLPPATSTFINNLAGFNTVVSGMQCDTLSLSARSSTIQLKECFVRSLTAEGRHLDFESGSVDNLYLDLDRTKGWNVNTESFHIDTEYLTARGTCHNNLLKGECRQVVWLPKGEKAKLELTLHEPGRVLVGE